jgi:carboxypeptidase C (cathepsin A)
MRTPMLRITGQKLAVLAIATLVLPLTTGLAQVKQETPVNNPESAKTEPANPEQFKPEQQASKGSVTIGGNVINYDAFAGTLVVHPKGWDDVPQNAEKDTKNKPAEASMFYVAYFKSDNKGAPRPLTFLYNGGPGSSTVWLHMGAFGPRRVVTADDTHTPPPLIAW